MKRHHSHLLAAAILALLVLLFFWRVLWPAEGQVLGGYDMRGYYYILPQVVREAVAEGHLPFWDPYRYNGTPFMADPQNEALYPLAWLMLILPVNVGISWFMALHVWLAALGMYALGRWQKGRWTPAMLAGICFAFGGYLAGRLWAGHSAVYAVTIWTPWMLLALGWAVRRGDWRSAIVAGIPFGLSILAGHYPSFLYVGLIWGAYVLYLFLTKGEDVVRGAWYGSGSKEHAPRTTILRQALIMALVGFGLAAVHLAPFIQFSLATERVAAADYDFATDYSLPPAHLITLVVPEFFGEPTRLGYWSVPTFEELSYYAGILPLLGLLLALRRPNRFTVFCLVLIVVGLWLALGRYGILYKLAFDWLPPFRLVRAPGRAAFLWLFGVTALLGRLGVESDQSPVTSHQFLSFSVSQSLNLRNWLRTVLIIAGVIGAAAIASAGATFMAIHPTETSGRVWHQINGEALALALFVIGGLLMGRYLSVTSDQLSVTSHKGDRLVTVYWLLLTKNWPAAALIFLAVADLWTFSWKMVRLESAAAHPLWAEAKSIIGETTERVLPWGVSVFEQNGSISVQLTSMFGYDSLEPADHLALAASVADPRSTAYDVLGVSYVMATTPLDQFTQEPAPLVLLGQQGSTWVYSRPRALPVARLVYAYEVIEENAAAIQRLHQPDFDPAQTVILSEPPACELAEGTGAAAIEATDAGYWRITSQSDVPALLVLAETAYPGWQVTIDGEPAEWQKAYTTLRAVCVPAGVHTVEWHFRPRVFWWGAFISLLTVTVIFVVYFPLRSHPTMLRRIRNL